MPFSGIQSRFIAAILPLLSTLGSGITMYVFNAGLSGMTASFSVDGGPAVSNTIQAPLPPTYQVSNVSLYNIQGIPTGNHTMKMTVLDWTGSGTATSMKFDYAYVNETFVATPATSSTSSMTSTSASQTSSQTSTQTSSTSNKSDLSFTQLNTRLTSYFRFRVNLGAIIGGTLGGLALLAGLVFGFFYLRKRKTTRKDVLSEESPFQVNPFTSEFNGPTPPSAQRRPFFAQNRETSPSVPAFTRSAILRDALAAGNYSSSGPDQSSQSIMSGQSSAVFQPLRRQPSYSADADPPVHSSASHVADASWPFSDPSRYNLTAEQVEVIDRLRADNVPVETIARVIEGFVSSNSNLSAGEPSGGKVARGARSVISAAPPPSYQTREG